MLRRHVRDPINDSTMGTGAMQFGTTPTSNWNTVLPKSRGFSTSMPAAWRHKVLGSRLRRQEQLLEVWSGHPLQFPPLLYGNQHGGFHAAFCNNLRTFRESGIEQLAEFRLRVLDWPFPAHGAPKQQDAEKQIVTLNRHQRKCLQIEVCPGLPPCMAGARDVSCCQAAIR